MRKPLVVGNWKLHGRLAENENRMRATVEAVKGFSQAQQLLANTNVMWGAQNVSQYEEGEYTSCVSAEMVAEFGCQLVILGHSERRLYSAENSQKAIIRIKRAVDAGLTPIYCIGETQEEHTAGHAKEVIQAQLMALLNLDRESLERVKAFGLVIAYEPVWAIGADQAATPALAQSMHAFIRALLATCDAAFADKTRIIYGGSLNPDNAKALFDMPDIDGGLVGRASLNPQQFSQICAAV